VEIDEPHWQGQSPIRLSDLVIAVDGVAARHRYRRHAEVVVAASALNEFGGLDDSPITCPRFQGEKYPFLQWIGSSGTETETETETVDRQTVTILSASWIVQRGRWSCQQQHLR
jgi:hypothetical protein